MRGKAAQPDPGTAMALRDWSRPSDLPYWSVTARTADKIGYAHTWEGQAETRQAAKNLATASAARMWRILAPLHGAEPEIPTFLVERTTSARSDSDIGWNVALRAKMSRALDAAGSAQPPPWTVAEAMIAGEALLRACAARAQLPAGRILTLRYGQHYKDDSAGRHTTLSAEVAIQSGLNEGTVLGSAAMTREVQGAVAALAIAYHAAKGPAFGGFASIAVPPSATLVAGLRQALKHEEAENSGVAAAFLRRIGLTEREAAFLENPV